MKKTLAWAVTAVTAATCALGASLPAAAADDTTAAAGAVASAYGLDTSSLTPHQQDLVDKILTAMPAGWQERAAATAAEFGMDDTPWANILDGVINPGDYQCSNTALTAYARDTLKDADPVFRYALPMLGVGTLAMYDAMLTADDPKSTTFGVNGEYTNELRSEGKDLKKFWDINSDDIQIVPMHGGDVFSSPERLARALYMRVPIGSVEGKLPEARYLIELINSEPALKGGTNPYFTFNSIAYTEKGSSHPRGISDHIVMGDGILQGMAAVGLGDTAPRSILAHEFGHHVQFEDNLISNTTLTGPEASRRVEMMADAFGTYFLTHSRGEALNTKRLLASEQSYYQVGDCGFRSYGHHGTPNQRLAASAWAASVVNDAANQGHIMPSLKLGGLFDAKLPDLVKPDATN
ncbi:hypothetical protein P3T27_003291 [Kitasatospora sp. MAA19]|uniref:hypothetical protein n=1 Tax=Kitasatospora sp. MAA19 TaxID=3035090 RepID=UPI002474E5EF|nr:hypothetical protein [Kitasatospora sp. MAA19]MDH6706564.1 hypothetical protein [Kitasatospora sp. MAA19]